MRLTPVKPHWRKGCYIPQNWAEDFSESYRREIRCFCLVMCESYIRKPFADIKRYANVIEERLDDTDCTLESVLAENAEFLAWAENGCANMVRLEDDYKVDIEI